MVGAEEASLDLPPRHPGQQGSSPIQSELSARRLVRGWVAWFNFLISCMILVSSKDRAGAHGGPRPRSTRTAFFASSCRPSRAGKVTVAAGGGRLFSDAGVLPLTLVGETARDGPGEGAQGHRIRQYRAEADRRPRSSRPRRAQRSRCSIRPRTMSARADPPPAPGRSRRHFKAVARRAWLSQPQSSRGDQRPPAGPVQGRPTVQPQGFTR